MNSKLGKTRAKEMRDVAGDARLNYLIATGEHPAHTIVNKERG